MLITSSLRQRSSPYTWLQLLSCLTRVDFGMTAWRDILNGRVIETAWQKTWLTLLLKRTSADSIVQVWIKHKRVHTCTSSIRVLNKSEVELNTYM